MRFRRCLLVATLSLSGCRRGAPVVELDHPQLTPQVRVIDTTVHSSALGRDMPLRIVVPADPALAAHELPVVYLLHGAGTNLHDWTNHSDIASFAAQGFVLVFPDAPGSYYIDDLRSPHNRYEQYLIAEIPAALHAAAPSAMRNPQHTAIVGISRGGYGAAVLGLKHPELFSFIDVISGALDFDRCYFRWSSPFSSRDVQRAFGPAGSTTRRENDPYTLLKTIPREHGPFFFVACGDSDSLLALNQEFSRQLATQNLPHETRFAPGAHNWGFWGGQLPALEAALRTHLLAPASETPHPHLTGTP